MFGSEEKPETLCCCQGRAFCSETKLGRPLVWFLWVKFHLLIIVQKNLGIHLKRNYYVQIFNILTLWKFYFVVTGLFKMEKLLEKILKRNLWFIRVQEIQNTFLEKYKVPKYQLTQVTQASWSQMKHSWRNTFKNGLDTYLHWVSKGKTILLGFDVTLRK